MHYGPEDVGASDHQTSSRQSACYVDGEFVGIMEREFPAKGIELTIPPEGIVLKILVENMGRINYGSLLCDRRGITDCVMLGRQILHGWTMFPLPPDDLSSLTFKAGAPSKFPAFQRGYFHVEHPEDSFFLTEGWSKGVCWINGFNVGRYWKRGPQQTLYVHKAAGGRNQTRPATLSDRRADQDLSVLLCLACFARVRFRTGNHGS